jgi:hypothetical protein
MMESRGGRPRSLEVRCDLQDVPGDETSGMSRRHVVRLPAQNIAASGSKRGFSWVERYCIVMLVAAVIMWTHAILTWII